MTTQTTPKARISPLFIGLAIITLALSSWGLFRLFHDFAHMPAWLAFAVIGGLDLAAVAFGKHALTVSADGDSPALWNLLLLAFMALAAYVQYVHAQLAGDPQIIGVTMAAFPVATVLLFEGQLRRVARVNGRAHGTVAAARQRVPLLVWVHFPVETWHATRAAIRVQGHLEDTQPQPEPAEPVETVKPAPRPARDKQRGQSVAASAHAAAERVGRDIDAVWVEVKRTTHPTVSRDTVKRSLNRPATNGQEVLR